MKPLLIMVCATLALAGCDNSLSSSEAPSAVRVAALPVIQDVIARDVPLFDGQWNAGIMDKICQVASDALSVPEFINWFGAHGVDVQNLAGKDSGFRFIATADKPAMDQACAAWLVSSLFSPVQAWGSAVEEAQAFDRRMEPQTPLVQVVIDNLAKLAATASGKAAYSSEQQFRTEVAGQFKALAPALINQTLKASFNPGQYRMPGSEQSVYRYQLHDGQMQVRFNGTIWLGDNEIKGSKYYFRIK